MWMYDKKLEYPIKITKPDGKMAKLIITQYGGPYFNSILLPTWTKLDANPPPVLTLLPI